MNSQFEDSFYKKIKKTAFSRNLEISPHVAKSTSLFQWGVFRKKCIRPKIDDWGYPQGSIGSKSEKYPCCAISGPYPWAQWEVAGIWRKLLMRFSGQRNVPFTRAADAGGVRHSGCSDGVSVQDVYVDHLRRRGAGKPPGTAYIQYTVRSSMVICLLSKSEWRKMQHIVSWRKHTYLATYAPKALSSQIKKNASKTLNKAAQINKSFNLGHGLSHSTDGSYSVFQCGQNAIFTKAPV